MVGYKSYNEEKRIRTQRNGEEKKTEQVLLNLLGSTTGSIKAFLPLVREVSTTPQT